MVIFPTDKIQKWSLSTSQGCSISKGFFLTRIKAWETEPFLRHSNQGHFPRDLKCGQENSNVCRHPGQDGHMGKPTSDAKGMMPIDPQTSPASPPRTVPWVSFMCPGSRLNSSEFVCFFVSLFFKVAHKLFYPDSNTLSCRAMERKVGWCEMEKEEQNPAGLGTLWLSMELGDNLLPRSLFP